MKSMLLVFKNLRSDLDNNLPVPMPFDLNTEAFVIKGRAFLENNFFLPV
jgi:hypothetical protein